MNKPLDFDFSVDKVNHTVSIKRRFSAPVDLVWQAWTNPDILDQWWAPKPYHIQTKSMDVRPGGTWLYAMISPQGEKQWCKAEYTQVAAGESYTYRDNFCDAAGQVQDSFPNSVWHTVFSAFEGATQVEIRIQYTSLEVLEKVIEVGFKAGFTDSMRNLDQYLEAAFKLRRQNKPNNRGRVCSYLNFDGETEAAFLFYRSVFQTEFIGRGIERFEDIPPESGHPLIAEAIKKMVLHVELPITGGHILMGTDAPKEMGFSLNRGNNMHICIEPETRAEADRLFTALSEGGKVTMPMADMFFGAYFGEFSDRYGINWMINYQPGHY